jgi:ribosomal protein L37AE/L43A
MMMDSTALFRLYEKFNLHYFGAALPYCPIIWSRQLTRTAGNIDVFAPKMKLSYPLLVEAFEPKGLFPPEFEICGVRCDSSQRAVEEILKHEMIHLWLHEQGLPSGHTAEFRAKARQMGQPKTRHQIETPKPRTGWEYSCPVCKSTFTRRKRFGRPVACAACCKEFNKGKFDARFKLRGKRLGE